MNHPSTASTAAVTSPDPRRWQTLWLVGIAQLMLILDVTVVAIALPHIGSDLGLDRESLTWIVSGYTLAFGGLLLLGGRLADLYGARRVIMVGLALFVVASLVAGVASSGPMLLSGRLLQGLAAALLSPAALSIVVTTFDGEERNKALGIWSALGGTGAALGVLLGGLLTAGPGWPWVFLINVGVGVIVIILLQSRLPRLTPNRAQARLDGLGALLVVSATALLIFALIRAGDHGWLTLTSAGLVAASALLYGLFAWRQLKTAHPLMDLHLLARRPVAAGTVLIFVATALMIMVFFLGTFYLQGFQGFSALITGLLFLPVAVATMIGANLAGRLLGRLGARRLGVIGLIIAAAGMALPAVIINTVPLIIGVSVAAAGTGVLFVVASATALGQVEPAEAGVASGIVSTFHEFGASIGAAVVSSVAASSLAGADGPGRGLAAGAVDGFSRGFAAGTIVAVAAAVVLLILTRHTPSTRAA